MTWVGTAGKARDLAFHAFVQRPAGADAWVSIASGSYEAVHDEARHQAALRGTRVLIIALSLDAEPPAGIDEKALLRASVPWY